MTRRPGSRWSVLLTPNNGVWAGLVLVAGGFAAIFCAWARVAGVLAVAQQVSYLIGYGIGGLALVIVGIMVVDVAARRQDRAERMQQIAQMDRTLEELREAIREPPDGEEQV